MRLLTVHYANAGYSVSDCYELYLENERKKTIGRYITVSYFKIISKYRYSKKKKNDKCFLMSEYLM